MSEIVENSKFKNYVYARFFSGANKVQQFNKEIFEGLTKELQRTDKYFPDYDGGEITIKANEVVYTMIPKNQ